MNLRLSASLIVLGLLASRGTAQALPDNVLVMDNNSVNALAHQAALVHSPTGTTLVKPDTFNASLALGSWDLVLLDNPEGGPQGALTGTTDWNPLISYILGGGRVIMSFGDWDASDPGTHPSLIKAFGCSQAKDLDWAIGTLTDAGTSGLFAGVTMPPMGWQDAWKDDGDVFVPVFDTIGLAHMGIPVSPCVVLGNSGRTIGAPVFDEASPGWLLDGSGVQLWLNMIKEINGGGGTTASCVQQPGVLGLNPMDCKCGNLPVMGTNWNPTISTTPLVGTATIATIFAVGLGGQALGIPAFGYELMILPTYVYEQAMGSHTIPIPSDPAMIGWLGYGQGIRIETDGTGAIYFVLTNGLDVVTAP